MPLVSIIVPCYNEQATIRLLLEALAQQDYPTEDMEVVIADGLSTDRTRAVIEVFRQDHPELPLRVVDNPQRNIPTGLNRALEAARGEFIIRLDAHSIPRQDYVSRCVRALERGKGDNVGGLWEIRPQDESWQARSVAAAAAHPLGVGDASYRVGSRSREVDTVPFGAFRRSLVAEVGVFDETLLSNEDYEFNVRIRQSGRTVWLDPQIRSVYFARPTFATLARQYWRYGFWKLRMLLRYPSTFRWRQLSGFFVLSFLVLGSLGVWYSLFRWLFFLEVTVYGLALLVAGIQAARKQNAIDLLVGVPVAIVTMHFSWGAGFLWSFLAWLLKFGR